MKIIKNMFSWSVKACKLIVKTMVTERLLVECVNGKMCRENMKIDANKSYQNQWKNDAEFMPGEQAEGEPTNDE